MCIRKRLLLSLVVGALCLNSGRLRCGPQAAAGELSESPPAQNLILITLSTLRADHLGSFGYERDTTPNFDAFAAQTVLFRNAFAVSSWMMPAHGSIFTSLYPSIHGATHIDKALRDEPRTLAEILGESGYYCIGFCCGPRLDQEYGFARGFDLYDDYTVSVMLDSMVFGDGQTTDINRCRTNNLINDAAIRWLQNNTHKPFFMFVHYYDNHWDYLPPAPYNKLYDPDYQGPIDGTQIAREPLYSNPPDKPDIQHIVALYDGEVRQTDKDLGEMLEFLKERGLYENSIIIVMGDHGEQFYEHGHTSHHGLFEELTHIPLAVSIPGAAGKGKVVDSLVSQVDILPTILDYLGIPIHDQCEGKSLRGLIEGKVETVNEFIFIEYTGEAVADGYAVRSMRYKYCEQGDESFAYDLLEDPKERHKIQAGDFPEEVKKLRQKLGQLRAGLAKATEPGPAGAAAEKEPNSVP